MCRPSAATTAWSRTARSAPRSSRSSCARSSARARPDRAAAPDHAAARADARDRGRPARSRSARARLTVRRVARGADDGYRSPLVIGLKSSTDAGRLAEELAFADHRLRAARAGPAGALPRGGGRRPAHRGAELARVPDRLPLPARRRGPVRGDRARPDFVGLGRAAGARRRAARAPDRPRPARGARRRSRPTGRGPRGRARRRPRSRATPRGRPSGGSRARSSGWRCPACIATRGSICW